MPYLLEPVGLCRTDNDVYVELLDAPSSSPSDLLKRLELPEETIRASLTSLCGAGLVHLLSAASDSYVAVPPEVAVPLLIQRQRSALARLQHRVDEMAESARRMAAAGDTCVEMLDGPDAVIAALSRLQGEARLEVCMVDAPPYLGGGPSRNDAELARLADGVSYRAIYHPDSLASAGAVEHMRECMKNGEQARVHSSAGPKLAIIDGRAAVIIANDRDPDPTRRILLGPSALLDVVIQHFELLWDKATPFDDVVHEGIGPRDRELLRLLASGMKDRAIARTLGVTERTVGRRVTELMERLDADTRFKAGVQAAQRNWI
ncbi:MAG TPA: helix-turn-helix domain-containing protein [Nocardioidaceae bacterium]|nr:helix-turn-helix domain-containing protein [Nocardioidaceae bacterium]